jgi:iron complex transport system substrate-binding protein
MRMADLVNGGFFALALGLSAYGGGLGTGRGLPVDRRGPELVAALRPETLADGTRVLRDAGGEPVKLAHYTRIVSGSIIADRVLAELCEPTRIAAVTDFGAEKSSFAHRLHGKSTLPSRAGIELVLAQKPDLYLVNNLVDPGYVARLREQGIAVFDLGHMRGVDTMLANVRTIGWLVGAPERGEAYAQALAGRLSRLAPVGDAARPTGLYVSVYGDKIFGGAARTSFHDVLTYAGLSDVAAARGLDGWPELSAESVLALDPEVLLTKPGMGAVLCRHSGLSQLRICRGEGRIIELPGPLLDDPGPAILEASEALKAALAPP